MKRRRAFIGVVVVLAALVFAGVALVVVLSETDNKVDRNAARIEADRRARVLSRADTCRFIDAEHDRTREEIAKGEQQLRGPFKHLFKLSASDMRRIHRQSKRRYDHVIDTRPGYCPPRTPIKPYPVPPPKS